MDTRPIEQLDFNEICRDLTEQALNGLIRGEKFASIVRSVAEGATYWRSEKTKAEEKARMPVPKVLVTTDPSYPAQRKAVEDFNATLRPRWPNGCDKTVPEALRYLARNDRPQGGESRFNAAHLEQLAQEIEALADAQNSCR